MGLFGKRIEPRDPSRGSPRDQSPRQARGQAVGQERGAPHQGRPARGIKGAQGAAEGPAGQRPGGAQGRRSRAQGSTRRQVAVTDADSPVADGFSAPGPDTDAGDIPGRDGCPRVDRPAARRSARGPAGTDRPVLRSWRPVVGAGWGSRAIVADGAGKEAEGRRNQTVRVGGDQSAHRSVGGRRGRGAHARKAAPDGPLGDLVAAGWHRGGPDGPARVDLTGGPMTAIGMSHPPRVHRRVGGQRTALTAGIGLLLAALVLTTIANPPAAFAHTAQLSTATPAPAVAATDANDVPTWPFVVGTVAAVAVAALWAVRRGR